MLRVWGLGVFLAAAVPAVAQDLTKPAELPPTSYAGQQYVDSRGCLFMRAGTAAKELWLPRVTRDGVPLCGRPPSGKRVPVAGEAPADAAAVATTVESAPAVGPVATGGYYVAVGSFGVAENADKALARLKSLNYASARGRLDAAGSKLVTVFAGPFASVSDAAQAQFELRGAGFPDAMVVAP